MRRRYCRRGEQGARGTHRRGPSPPRLFHSLQFMKGEENLGKHLSPYYFSSLSCL